MGEGVGDRGSRAGGFAAAAVAEATRLEEEDEGRCGRVRGLAGKGFAQGHSVLVADLYLLLCAPMIPWVSDCGQRPQAPGTEGSQQMDLAI